jgi:hypothetical protein
MENYNIQNADTLKVTAIRDNFGYVRFDAILASSADMTYVLAEKLSAYVSSDASASISTETSSTSSDEHASIEAMLVDSLMVRSPFKAMIQDLSVMPYDVAVISYCYSQSPQLVVNEQYAGYEDAVKAFSKNVNAYTDIVKAETKNWQDISIYADKIGYKTINPDCCANCKYGELSKDGRCMHERAKLVCTNSKLFILGGVFNPDWIPALDYPMPPFPEPHVHERGFGYSDCRHSFNKLQPEVQPNGICNSFEKRNK